MTAQSAFSTTDKFGVLEFQEISLRCGAYVKKRMKYQCARVAIISQIIWYKYTKGAE